MGRILSTCGILVLLLAPAVQAADNFALRFFGNGSAAPDLDRVKIQIDDPTNSQPGPPADIGAEDFTLEFWMRGLASENTSPAIVCGNNYDWILGTIIVDRDRFNQDRAFGISIAGGVPVFGVRGDGTGVRTICGTTNVLDNQWHHIAVQRRRSDGRMWLFVDGVLQAEADGPDGDISYPDDGVPSNNCNGPCTNSDPYLVIGAEKHDAGPPAFSGWVDEIRLSNSPRYLSDFTRPSSPFTTDPNTVALYHLDEGSGDLITDTSDAPGGPSNGVRRFGGSPAGPQWVLSDAPIAGTPPPPDTTPPTVSLTAPANGATVSGTVTVSANASDDIGVVGVQFRLDGAPLGTEDTSAPYSRAWDTTQFANGSHTLTAIARDAAANMGTSNAVTVTVNNSTPPSLTIPPTSLPAATVGSTYSQTLTATGGTTPYTWSIASGSLPAGLTLSSGGVLNGTPTAAGTSTFTVQVRDSATPPETATRDLSLTVNTPPPPPPAPAPTSDSGGGSGSGCFIATAAFGSALDPQVVLLRAFRDRYLLTHAPGRAFVTWYYRTSPPLAERIRESTLLRGAVRATLWPAVGIAWLALHPGIAGSVAAGTAGLAGGLWARRRRGRHPHAPPVQVHGQGA